MSTETWKDRGDPGGLTPITYTTEPEGPVHADLSSYSPEEIHVALVDAEVVTDEHDIRRVADVLDLPDLHSLEVGGERWDADSRTWTPT